MNNNNSTNKNEFQLHAVKSDNYNYNQVMSQW